MTLDDETAERIANEMWAKRSKRHTVGGEEYVRAGWDARDAEVEELRAQLAKVRQWAQSVALHPDPPADDEMAGQINAAGDVLAILDESPTERETCADEWEWGVRHVQVDGLVNVSYYPDRESALDDYLICGMDCALVRRRKAGPWEVCDDRA